MPLTDDDVKTRGQKEALNQIESNGKSNDEPSSNGEDHQEEAAPTSTENGEDKPKLTRDSTMAVTANVSIC